MKINWEYDLPKLRGIAIALVVILGVIRIIFEWTKADFIFKILLGITCVVDSACDWRKHRRGGAILCLCLALLWFVSAVNSFFKYNI